MNDKNYPLIEVIRIKKRRLDEAEKVLRDKKLILEKELEKLKSLQKQFDEAKKVFDNYLFKLREAMDAGEPSQKIDQHKLHLKELKERYLLAQKNVENQKKVVKTAEEAVEVARADYQLKEKEVEKLHIHKSEWNQAMKLEEQRGEDIKMDDISNATYSRKKKE
jgi:chromosome condensin MukBEF ATPase and DNA-binding subunit MukB